MLIPRRTRDRRDLNSVMDCEIRRTVLRVLVERGYLRDAGHYVSQNRKEFGDVDLVEFVECVLATGNIDTGSEVIYQYAKEIAQHPFNFLNWLSQHGKTGAAQEILVRLLVSGQRGSERLFSELDPAIVLGERERLLALEMRPENYAHLARCFRAYGDIGAAQSLFAKHLESIDPTQAVSPELLEGYLLLQRFDEAFGILETLVRQSYATVEYGDLLCPWFASYRHHALLDFLQDSLAKLERTQTSGRLDHWRTFQISLVCSALGREEEALGAFNEIAPEASGPFACFHYLAAIANSRQGRVDAAARAYLSMLEVMPYHWQVLADLAEVLVCQGRVEEAFETFERARAFNPRARANLDCWQAEMLLMLGRYEEALGRVDQSVESMERHSYGYRGAILAALGRSEAALVDLDRAMVVDPMDLESRVWRAEELRKQGEVDRALVDLDFVLEANPDYVWARVNSALIAIRLGDADLTGRHLERIDGDLLDRVACALRIERTGERSATETTRLLEGLLVAAKGNRRVDEHLFLTCCTEDGPLSRVLSG